MYTLFPVYPAYPSPLLSSVLHLGYHFLQEASPNSPRLSEVPLFWTSGVLMLTPTSQSTSHNALHLLFCLSPPELSAKHCAGC